MQFEEAFNFIMKYEGGYANHPSDKGGETNYGISSRFIRASGIKIKSVRDMTVQQAKEIYQVYFWNPIKAECFTDDLVQLFMFDTSVNCGASRAIDFLQSSINAISKIAVDGKIGNETISTCNKITSNERDRKILLELLKAARVGLYSHIVRNNDSQRVFLKGWINRVVELFNYGISQG